MAASDNNWLQVLLVPTSEGTFRVGYGIWGLFRDDRVSALEASSFSSWPRRSTWHSFCRANFDEPTVCSADSSVGELDDVTQRYCRGFRTVCGADMGLLQALMVIILFFSGSLCSLLLFGSRKYRVGVLYIASGLCCLLLVLCIMSIAEWVHITNMFGDVPIRMIPLLSASSGHSIQIAAESLCTQRTLTCYTVGSGFPFVFVSTAAAFTAFPVFLYAAYCHQKRSVADDHELRDPFLSAK